MVKFKKLIGAGFLAICMSSGLCVYAGDSIVVPTEVHEQTAIPAEKFSDEQIDLIKKYIQEEFEKLYAQKITNDTNEEIIKLRADLERQKRRATHYKHKLAAKKDYVSPQDAQTMIDNEKIKLAADFNKFIADFNSKAENKGKKFNHVDLTKMFQKFINLNLSLTLTNPGEVTVAQSAIQGKAK